MADEAPKIEPEVVEKVEKALEKSKFGRWILWGTSLLFVPLMGWLGNKALDIVNQFEALKTEVAALKADKANNSAIWASLADSKNHYMELKIQQEVMGRLFDREFSKSVMDKYVELQLLNVMKNSPEKLEAPPKPPVPKFEFKPIDPDQYRKEKESLYPPQTQKK